jgi:hypothetical protein
MEQSPIKMRRYQSDLGERGGRLARLRAHGEIPRDARRAPRGTCSLKQLYCSTIWKPLKPVREPIVDLIRNCGSVILRKTTYSWPSTAAAAVVAVDLS